jgi:hypothetical protein
MWGGQGLTQPISIFYAQRFRFQMQHNLAKQSKDREYPAEQTSN